MQAYEIKQTLKGISMSKNKLAKYFPMLKTREEIQNEINENPKLSAIFESWRKDQQDYFLDICTGVKGCKLLYDTYFKEIMNPETTPERLSRLLSIILKRKVKVIKVLANDNSRLGEELSLVITDIVVELEDGSIANVEVQKLGYAFTGQRGSCYSADLLLRQYKRVRDEKKEHFSYKDICPVYTIIFMENSPANFYEYMDNYIHTFTSHSDTGIELNLLQNIIYIPVDIFLQKLHNKKRIDGEFEAWLTFLGCDEPEYIIELIQEYPYFKPLYDDLYKMCLNVERIISMFSEELQILDRNTVKYMIDELQEKLDAANEMLSERDAALADKDAVLADKDAALADKDATLADKDALIAKLLEENERLKKEKR